MRYFLIAGEQSGDLHGANLVRELFRADPEAEAECWGGDLMQASGAKLLMHYRKTAYMGFVEVLKNLGSIKKNISLCKNQILSANPDLLILIDYPGFNLRIAEFARKKGFRVFYYISPKLWAWNEKRVEKVKKYVDRMYIIFPFEVAFYRKHNIRAVYCGNPLLDETEGKQASFPDKEECKRSLGLDDKPVIALLAGSRKSEVRQILPRMTEIIPDFREYQFVVAGVKNLPDALYSELTGGLKLKVIRDRTYEILHVADAALVASGTATLEAALFDVPQVVCFRGDFFSMLIAWMVIRVKYISLVNLIGGEEIVRELVQYSLNRKKLVYELRSILPGGTGRSRMLDGYRKVKNILGPSGASRRAAEDIVKTLAGVMAGIDDRNED